MDPRAQLRLRPCSSVSTGDSTPGHTNPPIERIRRTAPPFVRGATTPSFNLADLFEIVADTVPDREALVVGDRRLTYSQLEVRANRLAHWLASQGVGPGDHVGLQLMNGSEYIEGMLAAFKLRAVPINVNYRYVEAELRHLYQDAGLIALLYHRGFGPRVGAVAPEVASLRTLLVVEDDSEPPPAPRSVPYEDALQASQSERPHVRRSADDLYICYTGGTTGLPKGVVWRHEDIFKASMGGGDVTQSGNFIRRPEELAERIGPTPAPTALATPPLIHNSAHWLAFYELFSAGKLVLVPLGRFDPPAIWDLVGREQVFTLVLVGDAMARPLAAELAANPGRYDTNSLWVIGSGGAILSEAAKARLLAVLPGRMIVDAFGSSETGVVGNRDGPAGSTFVVDDRTNVLDEEGNPVPSGSGTVGRLARRGYVPLRYHNDPEKTARTFIEFGGSRWVLPGDMATVEPD
ncbi:MAG TPA: AMP-binding protein, partial [Actinomycetota bacterium]